LMRWAGTNLRRYWRALTAAGKADGGNAADDQSCGDAS
jgi:hypothetical protein